MGVSKKMLIKACHILVYAPSLEDTLRKEHDHGQVPKQLYQMTRYRPYRKKLWSKHNCLIRGWWWWGQKREILKKVMDTKTDLKSYPCSCSITSGAILQNKDSKFLIFEHFIARNNKAINQGALCCLNIHFSFYLNENYIEFQNVS